MHAVVWKGTFVISGREFSIGGKPDSVEMTEKLSGGHRNTSSGGNAIGLNY